MPKQKKYLQCPIFSILCLQDCFVVSVGGGGKRVGLANSVQIYPLPRLGLVLKDPTFTLELGQDDIIENMKLNQRKQQIVSNSADHCVVFQLENNEISQVAKFKTDFHPKEGYQNDGLYSPDGGVLATGGEDGIVRFWNESFELDHEFTENPLKIVSLDFHVQQPILLATLEAGQIKFINYKNKQVTQTLVLNQNPLKLRFQNASFFGPHLQFYTISNPMKGASFLTFWMVRPDQSVIPIVSHRAGMHPITSTCISADGNYLGLGGSDGQTSIFDIRNGQFQCQQESHEMIVKTVSFTRSGRYLVSGSPDFTYEFMSNEAPSGWCWFWTKFYILVVLLCVLGQLLMGMMD